MLSNEIASPPYFFACVAVIADVSVVFPVVHVSDRSHVYVRLRSIKFRFAHRSFLVAPFFSGKRGPSAPLKED